MDRAKYNACVASGLRGKKLSAEERRLEFCVVSKLCSGKSKSREDAKLLCSQPKPPKPISTRRGKPQSCEKEALKLSQCMAERIDMGLASNINSVGTAIANAMIECRCAR